MRKEILIRERAGVERVREYVRVSLPCARGELQPETALCVTGSGGAAQPCQKRVLKSWPDGSVKWLLLDFAARVSAGGGESWLVYEAPAELAFESAVQITPGAEQWQVHTGAGSFCIDSRSYRPFISVLIGERDVLAGGKSTCSFSTDGASQASPDVEMVEVEDPGPLHAVLRLTGRIAVGADIDLRFSSRLHFFAGSMTVRIEFTLHNPQAARHPGGLWDLGDPGSVLFRELSFALALATAEPAQLLLLPEPGGPTIEASGCADLTLYQESSGGENWRSANHRNRAGKVPFVRRGYVVESAGEELASGLRATPTFWCATGEDLGVAAALHHFWQEFPKAIGMGGGVLKIELFPARYPDLHELQGGEQKTHAFVLDFATKPGALVCALSPLLVTASPHDYRESGIFNDLPGEDDLVDLFATPADILAKREVLDEYGWRNFGELYADHESIIHWGEETFVSHYNNQYDFCAGAYRKAFATGDPGWHELASDLARHVWDIDLYHTDSDREEYNHGLFWHTDHYVDAGLSTHRSYSMEQLKGRSSHQCGGGPGPEHCYATGLMLHYFQTGNSDFRQAVIDLAEWELRSLEGSQTILAALKRGVEYAKLWRSFRGMDRLFPRYPLTRGTGNAVSTFMDAFEVGGGRHFLDRAEELIRGALQPKDDIAARHLLEAETAWSYTVLLVAVVKFLDKKLDLGELDDGFSHARASLLAYAIWMLTHERAYLEKPEILEYPNETWAAQDLRKSVIFYHAARYCESGRESFLQKGKYYSQTSLRELLRHDSSRFVRPITLMLQNGWVGNRLSYQDFDDKVLESVGQSVMGGETPRLSLPTVAWRTCTELWRAARKTSVVQELAWMKSRMVK